MSFMSRLSFALIFIGVMVNAPAQATDDTHDFEEVSLTIKKDRAYYGGGRPGEEYEDSREPTCLEEQCMLGYVCCADALFHMLESIHRYCGCAEENEQDKDDGYITYTGERFNRS